MQLGGNHRWVRLQYSCNQGGFYQQYPRVLSIFTKQASVKVSFLRHSMKPGVVCEVVAGFLRLYWMLLIESNSVNSGTEVLRENVCTYEVTCFTNKLFSIK